MVMLVRASLGLGKTYSVLNSIAGVQSNKSAVLLVPTLKKATEVLDDYNRFKQSDSLPALVFRGRGAMDTNNSPMCPRHVVAGQIAEAGLSIERTLCQECSLKAVCGYKRQQKAMSKNSPRFIIAAHDYLFLQDTFRDVALLVIDEDVAIKAAVTYEFTPDRITHCFPWGVLKKDAAALDIQQTLMKIEMIFNKQEIGLLTKLREQIKLKDIDDAIDFLEQQNIGSLSGINGTMDDAEISLKLATMERYETRKIICLLKQIRLEWDSGRTTFNSIIVNPHAYAKDKRGKTERQRRIDVYALKPPLLAKDVPTLLLDGTADVELNQRLFGCPIDVRQFFTERKARVTQIVGRGFSTQSLTGERSDGTPLRPAEAEALRNAIIARINSLPHASVLVVCSAKVEKLLKPLFANHVQTAHFGAVRGINTFEACEAVFLVGREQPMMEAIARAYAASDLEPFFSTVGVDINPKTDAFKATRGIRMKEGAAHPIAVPVHPHPIVQAVLEQVREAEIIQAIDRVRPLREQRHIYILNEVVLDIAVDEVITWHAWKTGGCRLEQVMTKSPVVPTSPAEMTRLFPELWGTQKTAECDIERTLKSQIVSLFGKRGFNQVSYKLATGRGKPFTAWVKGENRRAVLESVVGEVAVFQDVDLGYF